MFVSYVIATYNCKREAEVLVSTATLLGNFPCEFIVADGGSDDGTVEVMQDVAPLLRIVVSEPDHGIYDAWNKALPHCNGRYISFIGADDVPNFEFLRLVEARFGKVSEEDSPALIYGNRHLVRNGCSRKVAYSEKCRLIFDQNPVFDIPHPGALNSKLLFKDKNFDSSYKLSGDFEFYIRSRSEILNQGTKFIDKIQVSTPDGGVSRTSEALAVYHREYLRIERDHKIRLGFRSAAYYSRYLISLIPGFFDLFVKLSWKVRRDAKS